VLTVRAPATSANLGPGFDCLSLALDLVNVVHAEPAPVLRVDVVGEGDQTLPDDRSNEVYRALVHVFEARGECPPPLRLRCENRIPLARGLGSSSAARVSGLLVGNRLLRDPFTPAELLDLGADLEGHPDNIAACLLGGVQVTVATGQGVRHCRVPLPAGLVAMLFVPDLPMDTRRARELLPREVSLGAAVYNIGRAALLVAALAAGRTELLRTATEDALHQRPRSRLFPAMPRFLEAALEAGACGASLSGAGSSILALVGEEGARAVGEAFIAVAAREGVGGRVVPARIAEAGATIVGGRR
jgi:homoserine kinase